MGNLLQQPLHAILIYWHDLNDHERTRLITWLTWQAETKEKLIKFSYVVMLFLEKTKKCMLRRNFCDSRDNCGDGSDEKTRGFGFKCLPPSEHSRSPCILPQFMIDDGALDCKGETDQCYRNGTWRWNSFYLINITIYNLYVFFLVTFILWHFIFLYIKTNVMLWLG